MATPEQHAVGLYAVAARDVCDFIDMLPEASDETLQVLHEVLTFKPPGLSKKDAKLNDLVAPIVQRQIEKRGLAPRFAPVELPPFED